MRKMFTTSLTHPVTAKCATVLCSNRGNADATALGFVNALRTQPLHANDHTVFEPLPDGSDWRDGLRTWQIAYLRAEGILSEEEIDDLTDEGLAEAACFAIEIRECDASALPDETTIDLYRALADGLSHLVEEVGTINKMAFPDDYQWMVEIMAALVGRDPGDPRSIEEIRALGRRLAGEYEADQAAAA